METIDFLLLLMNELHLLVQFLIFISNVKMYCIVLNLNSNFLYSQKNGIVQTLLVQSDEVLPNKCL